METAQPQPSELPHSERLTDDTRHVQGQLQRLLEQGSFVARPEGLFLSAPGNHLQWTDYIDKGCRGGWSEHRQTELDDQPLAITRVERAAGTTRVDFHVTAGNTAGFVALDRAELPQVRFFQQSTETTASAPSHEAFAGSLDELLHDEQYAYLPDVPARFNDRYDIRLLAKHPLDRPISRESRSYTDPHNPLDENVTGLEVWRDPEGQLMIRTPFDETRSLYRVGKDLMEWLPLDTVSFRLTERTPQQVLEARLGRLARKLVALQHDNSVDGLDETHAGINHLLATAEQPVSYASEAIQPTPLPRWNRQTLVVMDAALTHSQIIQNSDRMLRQHYIIADEVKARRAASWVIDREHDIAVPLTEAAFKVKDLRDNSSWHTHLRELM